MTEEWRKVLVDGEPWPYEVSNTGRVRRTKYAPGTFDGRVLSPGVATAGYEFVGLHRGGERRQILVHRLVAIAFLGEPPEESHDVNHKNGDKRDNRSSNLEWVTRAENIAHAFDEDLTSSLVKLTKEDAIEIYERAWDGEDHGALADEFGIARSGISQIKHGHTWQRATGHTEMGCDNVLDHAARGESHGSAKLSAERVVRIRKLAEEGVAQRQIARRFGVSKTTVGQVIRRETWTHV